MPQNPLPVLRRRRPRAQRSFRDAMRGTPLLIAGLLAPTLAFATPREHHPPRPVQCRLDIRRGRPKQAIMGAQGFPDPPHYAGHLRGLA
ncbi:hypothetical protein MOR12E_05765 [Methylobacterium oryzae]